MLRRRWLASLAGTWIGIWPDVAIPANFLAAALPEPVSCSDDFAGGLSDDGHTIAVNRICYSPTTGTFERRATIARDFRNPAALPSLQTIGGWVLDLSGDGRSAAATIPVASPLDPESLFDRGALIRETGETLEIGALLPDFYFNASSYAYALSSWGEVLVGAAPNENGGSWPVIWSQASGLQAIEFAPPSDEDDEWPAGHAADVSGDGRIVAGSIGSFGAFLWSAEAGLQFLSDPGDPTMRMGNARAISRDGSVVVGDGVFEGISQPVLWSQSTGLAGLGPTHAITLGWASPRAVSADGKLVVGGAGSFLSDVEIEDTWDRAFLWTADSGIQSLRRRLEEVGVLTSAWRFLDSAWAVSGDGSVVAGGGRRIGSDVYETFLADLREATSRGVDLCDETDPDCVRVEIVARSGQLVRLEPWEDQVVDSFEQARLNHAGGVAFLANATSRFPDGISGGRALFGPDRQGRARLCAAWNTPAPNGDAPSAIVSDVDASDFALDEEGQIVFTGQWRENPFSSTSIPAFLRCDPATETAEVQVRAGDPLAEPSGGTIDAFDLLVQAPNFQVDGLGRVAFRAHAISSPGDPASPALVVPDPAGGLRRLIGIGDSLPGYPSDFRHIGTPFYTMSANGSLAFTSVLDQLLPVQHHDIGVFATDPSGAVHAVIRPGDPAPGFPGTTVFADDGYSSWSASRPAINEHGEVVALAFTRNPEDAEPRPRASIWRWSPKQPLSHVISESDDFPGLADGMQITALAEPWIDAAGDVLIFAFTSGLTGVDSAGYWLRTPDGTLLPLLRSGQPAPDLPEGVVLTDAYLEGSIGFFVHATAALAENGRSLMEFRLAGPGVDATNDRALFTVDRSGDAKLVIRRGAQIEVAYEDVRAVEAVRIDYGYQSGLGRSPLNERGEIAAVLEFTDGSQAVAKLAVPEPRGVAIWATLVLAFGALGRARRTCRAKA